MEFGVGDRVIYPKHGAGTVLDRETRQWNGERVQYLVVDLDAQEMTVRVPAADASELGVRPPIDEDEVGDVLEVLGDHDVRIPQNFSRRMKNNQDRLRTGEVYDTAAVVRDLSLRRQRKHLSPTEQDILKRARRALATELAIALDDDVDVAEQRIDDAVSID